MSTSKSGLAKSVQVTIPGSLESISETERDQVFLILKKAGFSAVEFGGDSQNLVLCLVADDLEVEEE